MSRDQIQTTGGASSPLDGGPRPLRRVEPPDAPWAGFLAHDRTGAACLLVDRGLLEEWTGWDAVADGHIVAPRDVVRRSDGHDVVLPACVQRLETFLERRQESAPLSAGETVTLAVSLLRGVSELQQRPPHRPSGEVRGTWWLTDAGRPMFVGGEGEPAAAEAVRFLSDSIAPHPRLVSPLARCVDVMTQPRSTPRETSEIEEELFRAADAEPLTIAVLSPTRVRPIGGAPQPAAEPLPTGWRALVDAHVDSSLFGVASTALTAVTRSLRARRRSASSGMRRRPLAIAAAAGTAALLVGLLWPTGTPGRASADIASTDPPRSGATTSARSASPSAATDSSHRLASTPPSTSLPARTDALLTARLDCHGSLACLATVVEDPRRPFPEGASAAPAEDRTVSLVDQFGGAAVLRVESRSRTSTAQYVVIVREKDGWLLRDVHDAGQQPSDRRG